MSDANVDVLSEETKKATRLGVGNRADKPDAAETSRLRKGKKGKGGKKKKKRAEETEAETAGEDIGERGNQDDNKERPEAKKKKAKTKGKKPESSVSVLAENSAGQELPSAEVKGSQKEPSQETIIAIRDNKGAEDSNLLEIISDSSPKKDSEAAVAGWEQNNIDGGEAGTSSGDEKKDERKGSDGEETSETIVEKQEESEGKEQTENVVARKISKKEDSAIRRLATLSFLVTSVDENVEQAVGEPEVRNSKCSLNVTILESRGCI